MSLKILIADDHALLRQGLRQLLGDENPDYQFAEADGFHAALDALAANQADLFISLHFNSVESSGMGRTSDESGIETYCVTPAGAPSNRA